MSIVFSLVDALGSLLQQTFGVFDNFITEFALHSILVTSPFWLPIVLGVAFWFIWIDYVRSKFIASQKYVLLELKLPPEVFKSPLAMEIALTGLHLTGGEGTWYAKYVQGKLRPWFSLEIVSLEGVVHFYIWTRAGFKNVIESQLYGQYPNIEITEVDDYTDMMPIYDKEKFGLWGCQFKLTKPDPYPIKTYIDYGLDRDPKEELKIDPLTSVIEFMSLLGKGEYIWLQYVIRAHKEKPLGGSWFHKTNWQDETRATIEKIYEGMKVENGEDKGERKRSPTQLEKDTIEALERSATKYGFDVGIRGIYLGEGDKFNGGRIGSFTNIFKVFGSPAQPKKYDLFGFNSFAPTKTTDFNYPWDDFRKIREMKNRKKVVAAYRRRSFFHAPYKYPHFVLNTEELATIFHPVGTVLQTPQVNRVASRKAEAPGNLPR